MLNIDAERNVTLLYPNTGTRLDENRVTAGRTWSFPPSGTRIVATLPPGQAQSVELLQVIAVRGEPRLFADATATNIGPYKVLTVGGMNTVIERLAALKRTQWTTATAAYTIQAK